MATIPAAGHISDSLRTEGEVKADLEAVIASLRQVPGSAAVELAATISGGSITPAGGGGIIVVDTESAAATDDLANIIPTNYPDNACILLRNANAARVVTLKHGATGSGQMFLDRSVDYVLDDTLKYLLLQRRGNDWYEVVRGPQRLAMPVVAKNANFTIQKEDIGKVFYCTNGITVSFAAAASLGNGFFCSIINANLGTTISLDPNGSETINNFTALVLPSYRNSIMLVCDGTAFYTPDRLVNLIAQTMPFNATITLNVRESDYFEVGALTGNITTFNLNDGYTGKKVRIRFVQDATGGRTVVVPTSAKVTGTLASAANQATHLDLIFVGGGVIRWEGQWIQIPL